MGEYLLSGSAGTGTAPRDLAGGFEERVEELETGPPELGELFGGGVAEDATYPGVQTRRVVDTEQLPGHALAPRRIRLGTCSHGLDGIGGL